MTVHFSGTHKVSFNFKNAPEVQLHKQLLPVMAQSLAGESSDIEYTNLTQAEGDIVKFQFTTPDSEIPTEADQAVADWVSEQQTEFASDQDTQKIKITYENPFEQSN